MSAEQNLILCSGQCEPSKIVHSYNILSTAGKIKTVGVVALILIATTTATTVDGFTPSKFEGENGLVECIISPSTSYTDTTVYNNGVSMMEFRTYKRFSEIGQLQDNWNGNGAKAFSQGLIKYAQALALSLSTQPNIYPTACNSIQFEYEKENGEYLEFEIFENKKIKMFMYQNDDNFKVCFLDGGNLNEVVKEFYAE